MIETRDMPDHPGPERLVRAVVLASSILLMLPGAWGHSVTAVEFSQLPAGLAAWQRHSLGIYRVCAPLSKLLYALPAHLAGVRVDYPASLDADTRHRREWDVGQHFQMQIGPRYHSIYRWSRLLPILVTVLGGCLICEWSTRLFGPWPGVVSLCVWCWMSPALAHGSLVTSDMLSAVMLVLAARTFWAFLLGPGLIAALLAGLALGLAVSTKFTLLILYPCWLMLLFVRAIQRRGSAATDRPPWLGSRGRFIVQSSLVFLISLLVVDALYFFQDVGFHLSRWDTGQSWIGRDLGRLADHRATAWLLEVPVPIPLEFVRGLDFQLADTERLQSGYLLGESRPGGWWYWYPVAALFKVPLPAIALFGLALIRLPKALRQGEPIVWAALCLLLPAAESALVISATTGTGTNAAFRYLLPSLALLCVWTGQSWSAGSRLLRSAVIVLLTGLAVNALAGLPDHLGWLNELGRFCSRQRPVLLGDSLDWGQDLARLAAWVSRHSDEGGTKVCVYGLGAGEAYGLCVPAALPLSAPWESSLYLAVSANALFGYETYQCLAIQGTNSPLTAAERDLLLTQEPYDRVGNTIRIYRIRGLEALRRLREDPNHWNDQPLR